MRIPFFSQLPTLLTVWLQSYGRTPFRLLLIIVSIAATCMTFIIGWNLSDALNKAKPVVPDNEYLLLAVGAGTEARSFIPLDVVQQLRAAFSASPNLRQLLMRTAIVLPSDIILDAEGKERMPATLRGMAPDQSGRMADLSLVSGRMPQAGKRELLLSPTLQKWLQERQNDTTIKLAQVNWDVVGVATRAGAASQVEMYGEQSTLQQQFQVIDILNSITLTLDKDQFNEVKQLTTQLKDARLELISSASYGGDFVAHLYRQLKTFWLVFLIATLICTLFGVHTVAMALQVERNRIRDILFRIGFAPKAIRWSEIAEGGVIGLSAALLAALLFAALSEGAQIQSMLPSGAVNLGLQTSWSGLLWTLVFGFTIGAVIFSWRKKALGVTY